NYQATSISTDSQYQVIDHVPSTMTIADLAKEPGFTSASVDFIKKQGGSIVTSLLNKVPDSFYKEASSKELIPIVDFYVYRLYPSYQPNFPGYDQNVRLSGWHLPIDQNKTFEKPASEILISVSTHPEGVNKTNLLLSNKKLTLESSSNPHYFWNHYGKQIEKQSDSKNIVELKD